MPFIKKVKSDLFIIFIVITNNQTLKYAYHAFYCQICILFILFLTYCIYFIHFLLVIFRYTAYHQRNYMKHVRSHTNDLSTYFSPL